MSEDANELMSKAQKQLEEHKVWLAKRITEMMSTDTLVAPGASVILAHQVSQITLRMVKADKDRGVTVVWDYPDELIAFLRDPATPKDLRDTLAGGHVVSTEQPAFTAKRE